MHTILLLLYTSVRLQEGALCCPACSMCCNGVHDAYAVSMEDTVTLFCVCCMRVAFDEVWLEHSVMGYFTWTSLTVVFMDPRCVPYCSMAAHR